MTLSALRSHLIECFEPDFRIVGNIAQHEIVEAIDAEAARLAAMTGERDSERAIAQEWESKCDALEAKLAAMTTARDEACDLAECIVGEPPARIAELRAVGKNPS